MNICSIKEQQFYFQGHAEELASNHDRILSVVEEGYELCKHTTGDEAVGLQARLDSLRIRYANMSNTTDRKLAVMQDALPLAELFHDTHKQLSDALAAIESDLSHLDDAMLDQQQELIHNMEEDISHFRPALEQMNSTGVKLGHYSPGEGAATLEEMSSRLQRRFDAVNEQVQRRGERLNLTQQRSHDVLGEMDDLIDWFQQVEQQICSAGAACADPELAKQQLKDQRAMNNDVAGQRSRAKDKISHAKKMLKEFRDEDAQRMQDKIEVLKGLSDAVSQLSEDRLSVLEQALPLAEHFSESFGEISTWLTTAENELAHAPPVIPGIHNDQLKKQQEHNKVHRLHIIVVCI